MGDGVALPTAERIRSKAGGENFPVAPRIVPARYREPLLTIYGFARLVDDAGDDPGDATARLDEIERALDHIRAGGTPPHPVLARLATAVREHGLPTEPLCRLLEANRLDGRKSRYETFGELLSYCELSANPVGELVLHVLGVLTGSRLRLSDLVCTALQLVEHLQDVGEDLARGRIYLPREDLERFEVAEDDLAAASADGAVRALVAFSLDRAERILSEGAPIVGSLGGWGRLLVAGYVAGGRAAVGAIRRADHDVLAGMPRAGRSALVGRLVITALGGR